MPEDTMNVIVHKAEIQLLEGETISGFTQALCSAAHEYLKTKLSLGKEDWVYTTDVKAKVAVANVYKREGKTSYWAVNYERDEKGTFSFSDLTEVRPVMSYVPVSPSLSVSKSAEHGLFQGIL